MGMVDVVVLSLTVNVKRSCYLAGKESLYRKYLKKIPHEEMRLPPVSVRPQHPHGNLCFFPFSAFRPRSFTFSLL